LNIFKKRRRSKANGAIFETENYYVKHKFQGDKRPFERCLGTPDKQLAFKRAVELIDREERIRDGRYIEDIERDAAKRPILDVVGEYIDGLIEDGREREHHRKVGQRLRDGIAELGWSRVGEIRKNDFRAWLEGKSGWTPKTRSHYRAAFKAFTAWLHQEDMLPEDPLANLKGVRDASKREREPATLTESEATKLLASAPEYRSDFYAILLYTGMRPIELKRAKVGWVRTEDDGRMWILIPKSASKARRDEPIEVPVHLEPLLGKLTAGRPDSGCLMAKGRTSRRTFDKDIEAAGIEKLRADGSVVSMYSLRHTFVTWTASVTDAPEQRRRLARHTSSNLTETVYTNRKALGLHACVDRLPNIMPEPRGPVMDGEAGTETDDRARERSGERDPAGGIENGENPGVGSPPRLHCVSLRQARLFPHTARSRRFRLRTKNAAGSPDGVDRTQDPSPVPFAEFTRRFGMIQARRRRPATRPPRPTSAIEAGAGIELNTTLPNGSTSVNQTFTPST
jgi:integrase